MARSPIDIGVGVDGKAVKQGIETGVIPPIKDAEKALDDLANSHSPEQLETELDAAALASKRLKSETDATADAIEQDFRRAYAEVKTQSNGSLGSAAENTKEFKQEAAQNFSEVASSFNGSMTSIQDLAQGTLGGLASALPGPLAFAAGGAAIGVGIVGSIIEGANEKREELAQEIRDAVAQAFASGEEVIDDAKIKDRFGELWNDPEFSAQAESLSKRIGVSADQIIRAAAGDDTSIKVVQEAVASARAELEKLGRGGANELSALEIIFDPIEAQLDTVAQMRRDTDLLRQAWEDTGPAISHANSAAAELRDTVKSVPDEVKVKATVDTTDLDRTIRDYAEAEVAIKVRVTDELGRTIR